MFKAIVRFSIRKKLFVGLTTLFLFIGGIYAMLTLPIDAVPDITNNQVQIVTVSPTLAPQEVEQLITMPIEIAMSNIMNVEDIRSVSRFGLSVVTVVFKEDVPTLDARQLINEQIQTVSGEISPELGTPEMMPITTGLGEIYQYILKVAPGYEEKYDAMELRTIQDWMVKRQLSGIPGIVEINSFGGYLKQYEVAVDPDALFSLNITIGEVFEALSSNNQNTGGSYIEKAKNAYYIRSEGMITRIKDIEQIVVANRNGIPVHISDVGAVRFGAPKRFGAMTMDGKIATYTGASKWITSETARAHVQEQRHKYTAIMVGVGTVLADNPMLNCRMEGGKNPIRIICDTHLRTPLDTKIVATAKEIQTILATCCADRKKQEAYLAAGCQILQVNEKNGHVDLQELMQKLGEQEIDSILIEGGGTLHWTALEEGIVQKVQAYIAPKLFGGRTAKTPIEGQGVATPAEAFYLKNSKIIPLGEDFLIESEVSGDVHGNC